MEKRGPIKSYLREYVVRTVRFYSPERGLYIVKDSVIGYFGLNYKKNYLIKIHVGRAADVGFSL
jgi:hypothetical protein